MAIHVLLLIVIIIIINTSTIIISISMSVVTIAHSYRILIYFILATLAWVLIEQFFKHNFMCRNKMLQSV